MATLYISDLDGTLLGTDSTVSEFSKSLLSEVIADGALFSVATARTPATVSVLLAGIPAEMPYVVMTGAALWNQRNRCFVNPRFMNVDLYGTISKLMAEEGVNPFIYVLPDDTARLLDVYHSFEMNPAERKFYDDRRAMTLKKFFIGHKLPSDMMSRVMLMYTTGSTEAINRVAERIRGAVNCSMSVYPDIFDPSQALIEIFAPGVSKADTTMKMAEEYGITRVVAFGDNLNDLPLLEVADVAVAVANAHPDVKAVADIVIGPNYTDSVAKFIADDFAKNLFS